MVGVKYVILKPYTNSAEGTRAAWVAMLMPGCEATATKLGRSPEAIVAQAALEAGYGHAAPGNNLFGIKAAGGWKGPIQTLKTREVINGESVYIDQDFRVYSSIQGSIDDRFKFLVENTRYRDAGVFTATSDEQYFERLQQAGYATDTNYAKTLVSVLQNIRRYTSNMKRVEIGDDYQVQTDGNIVRKEPVKSRIVADAKSGSVTQIAGVAAGIVVPVVAATQGHDWKALAVLGACVVVLSAVGLFFFFRVHKARDDMSQKGIV